MSVVVTREESGRLGAHTVEGCIHRKDLPIAEVTKPFPIDTLLGIALDDGSQSGDGIVDRDAGREEPVQARAVILGPEIEGVFTGRLSNKAYLGKVRTCATVGASGDA